MKNRIRDQKYAGILPISKEMLSDTDQNLISYVSAWFAKKDVVTRNSLIIAIMKTLAKKPVANVDSLKDILNVDLDPAISLTASIVTNQDGFNLLDKLKDSEGRYLLQPNPLNPTQKLLFAHPVTVVSNKYLPSATSPKKRLRLLSGLWRMLLCSLTGSLLLLRVPASAGTHSSGILMTLKQLQGLTLKRLTAPQPYTAS